MTARPDITKPENMLAIQGDRVIVYTHGHNGDLVQTHVLTLVQVIGEKREVAASYRESQSDGGGGRMAALTERRDIAGEPDGRGVAAQKEP